MGSQKTAYFEYTYCLGIQIFRNNLKQKTWIWIPFIVALIEAETLLAYNENSIFLESSNLTETYLI